MRVGDILHYTLSSSIEQICEKNGSFDSGVVHIAYPGENRNGSSISKDVFEQCIDTIYYCPIVCNYDRDTNDIGGHDIDIVPGKNGKLKIVNATTPVGVIPENANYWWEEVDGREYLCTEALLWKRQEEYDKLKEDGHIDLSMEISIRNYHMDGSLMVVDSFEFLALCLLGSDVEPCYESASLEVFSADEFKAQYLEMVASLKSEIKTVNTSAEDDIEITTFTTKGDSHMDKQKLDLLAKYGLTAEELDFDIEDMTLEELEAKFNDMNEADDSIQEEPVQEDLVQEDFSAEEPNDGEAEPTQANMSLSGEQLRNGLIESLGAVKFVDEWGYESSRYWYNDYNPETQEVYCTDCEDWGLYGFGYSVSGDVVTIDFDTKKKMKYAIVEFEDGDEEPAMFSVFEKYASSKVASEKAQFEQKLAEANQRVTDMESELDELRSFQSETLAAEREAQEEEVFSQFADLEGVEAFDELRDNCSDMSIEDIEEKCFALRGRQMQQNFSVKKTTSTRLPAENQHRNESKTVYGGIFEEFPPANRN